MSRRFFQVNWKVISILFSAGLISFAIYHRFNLDILQKIFSILGSSSLGVALITYFYKKRQDELLATVDQITFLREKIIQESATVLRALQKKKSDYVVSRIELTVPEIDFVRKKFSANFERQLQIFFDASLPLPSFDSEILDKQIYLLNMLEEFSLRIVHSKIEDNPAFESIYNAFVTIVEQNAVALLFMRYVKSGNQSYSTILSLYKLWKQKTEKTNFVKNLEIYGLITKEQKNKIYQARKEKIGV